MLLNRSILTRNLLESLFAIFCCELGRIAKVPGIFFAGTAQQFMYFQLRCLPSAIQSMAVAMRLSRVSSRLASAIHSMYSRRQLGLKFWNVAAAALFFLRAAARPSGTGSSGLGFVFR